jgi:(p)ppGpp synthase/HD superfamily hydrolase
MNPPAESSPDDLRTRALLEDAGVLDVWRFAAEHHAGQLRASVQAPFIHHPEQVAELVVEAGGSNAMVAAALLHDLLEDTPMEAGEIEAEFGAEVAGLVQDLSDDPAIDDYEERKAALREQVRRAGDGAVVIYAADKLANAGDLRAALASDGRVAESRLKVSFGARVRIWREDVAMCRRVLGAHELCDRLDRELDALERERESLGPAESIL